MTGENKPPDQNFPPTAREQAERALSVLGDQLREVEEQVRLLRRQFEETAAAIRASLANAEGAIPAELSPQPAGGRFPDGAGPTDYSENAAPENSTPAPAGQHDPVLHRDAARYARLLVSEIELYNAAEVSEGRAHRDLYSRLQPQIRRSRTAYENRYGPSVIQSPDYFHEELVRTLAGGDASLLGAGDSGPSV